MKRIRKITKKTFAIVAAMPWIRVKPRAPAINAMIAKMMAHFSTANPAVELEKEAAA